MRHQLTTRESRFLAVGMLFGVLVFLLSTVCIPMVRSAQAHFSQASDLQFQLEKYRRAVAKKPGLEHRLASLKNQQLERLIYRNSSSGVVAATIQNSIRQSVEQSQGALISTQVLPEKTDDHFKRVAIGVRLTGNEKVLQQLLLRIESAQPLLVVEKLVIAFNRRVKSNQALTPVGPLNIQLEVASYLQRREG